MLKLPSLLIRSTTGSTLLLFRPSRIHCTAVSSAAAFSSGTGEGAAAAGAAGAASSSSSPGAESSSAADVAAAVAAVRPPPPPVVPRHGPGDGLIVLNVGGKEFTTLRSTVQECRIARAVAAAEANGEATTGAKGTTTVFIDRDPTHFPLILTYLRNKAEGIAYNNRYVKQNKSYQVMNSMVPTKLLFQTKMARYPQYVRLPKDECVLEQLYVEAVHFELTELQHQLCHTSFIVTIMSVLGGGRNPFQTANETIKMFRNTALTLVGTGSIIGGVTATLQADMDWLEDKVFPGRRAKREEKEKKAAAEAAVKNATTASPAPLLQAEPRLA